MKENKWVLGLIGIILVAAIWYIYPILFPKQVESTSQEYVQATKLIKEGKLEEARPLLMKGIAKEPGEGKYHFALGNIARQQNKLEEALVQYDQTIQKTPGTTEAYNNKAGILMLQNKPDEALTVIESGLQHNPAFQDLLFKKGQLLYVKKDYAQAIAVLQPLSSDANYVEAYRFVGLCLREQQKYDQAVEQLQVYLQKTPQTTKGRAEVEQVVAAMQTQVSSIK
ncbi:tetratricopeptide repeat protein [Paenibacillus periandrae]|uniref:tetratricopeptide repeat protein n=1 Tax=Paenibacillus periandrae TaxID=1761741 RepID=UPI001F094D1F|nr:tetratricopeptide repeat protein [Paenibacillus periandrae]